MLDDSNRDHRPFNVQDDPDPVIQQAVFDILLVAIEVDKEVVKKKATATRNSHRDVRLCDLLLKQC